MSFRIRIRALVLVLVLAWPFSPALSFQLDDVVGDDNGAGHLFYPNREDMRRGDLDIVWMRVENEVGGTWFTIRFKNPVASPKGRVTMLGQTPLEQIVRVIVHGRRRKYGPCAFAALFLRVDDSGDAKIRTL